MMLRRSIVLAACSLLCSGAIHADGAPRFGESRSAGVMAVSKDSKTIGYVERTHLQLDRWGARLVSRLEQGRGPRQSDPLLDGRYGLQVLKLRLTYAGYAQSAELAAAIRQLADTHERRRRGLEKMMRYGVDREIYARTSLDAEQVMSAIHALSIP